jgi:hypothetical protein
MSRRSATRWKQRTIERTHRTSKQPRFSFFLNFSLIFPINTSRNQTFLFFTIFYIFLWTRIKKDVTTKIGTYNWGGMGSTEIQHVLWKACKNFDNLFSLFSWFFWQFWWNQIGTEEYVELWVGTNMTARISN